MRMWWVLAMGCTTRTVPPVSAPSVMVVPVPAPVMPTDPVAGTLASAGVVLGMPRERQAEEIERWSVSLDRTQQPTDRLRLAMLLAMGDPAVRDADRVRDLLQDQAWTADHGGYEMLARLLLEVVETRAEADADRVRLLAKVLAEAERSQVVQEQLDALKQVESDLDARTDVEPAATTGDP